MTRDAFVGLLLKMTGLFPNISSNTFWSSKNVMSPKKLVIEEFELGVPINILMLGVTGVDDRVLFFAGVATLGLSALLSSSLSDLASLGAKINLSRGETCDFDFFSPLFRVFAGLPRGITDPLCVSYDDCGSFR